MNTPCDPTRGAALLLTVLCACTGEPPAPAKTPMHPDILAQTWKATTRPLAEGGHRLVVEGLVQVPSSGYRCSLRKAEPQGINARILLLELSLVAPGGPALQVLTDERVELVEDSDEVFEGVQVLCAGELLQSLEPVPASR